MSSSSRNDQRLDSKSESFRYKMDRLGSNKGDGREWMKTQKFFSISKNKLFRCHVNRLFGQVKRLNRNDALFYTLKVPFGSLFFSLSRVIWIPKAAILTIKTASFKEKKFPFTISSRHGYSMSNRSTNLNLKWGSNLGTYLRGRTFDRYVLHKRVCQGSDLRRGNSHLFNALPPHEARTVQPGIISLFVERFETRAVKKVRNPPMPNLF